MRMPLTHFHYDRFDTPDDEQDGKWSVNFLTNPQGEIDRAEMSLDQAAVMFTRRVPAALSSVATLGQYLGSYETPSGGKFDVVLRPGNSPAIQNPDGTFQALIPWQPAPISHQGVPRRRLRIPRREWTCGRAQAVESFRGVHVRSQMISRRHVTTHRAFARLAILFCTSGRNRSLRASLPTHRAAACSDVERRRPRAIEASWRA